MAINPIEFGLSSITGGNSSLLSAIQSTSDSSGTSGISMFSDLFESAIADVKTTSAANSTQLESIISGESDDVHNLIITSTKATLSVQMLVQLRNKVMDSYNEVMQMNV